MIMEIMQLSKSFMVTRVTKENGKFVVECKNEQGKKTKLYIRFNFL